MDRIRVLIVDDHAVVRQGLRSYLELKDDIEVAGEAATGAQALAMLAASRPDVALMDLVMPEMDGVQATRRILAAWPDVKVIVLSSFTDDERIFAALEAGATGYLLKDVKPAELADAIRAARRGDPVMHPEVMRKVMRRAVGSPAESGEEQAIASLTERELEVLRLLAQGMSNRELAQTLGISEKTVKTHVSSILSKLDVADRTQAALLAQRHGLAAE
ncbi:MAG: response regulator transcription factor [Caldilineales bacterium]